MGSLRFGSTSSPYFTHSNISDVTVIVIRHHSHNPKPAAPFLVKSLLTFMFFVFNCSLRYRFVCIFHMNFMNTFGKSKGQDRRQPTTCVFYAARVRRFGRTELRRKLLLINTCLYHRGCEQQKQFVICET